MFVLYLGVGGGSGASGNASTVVAVGGRQFDARDVLRVRQRQEEEYRRVLGDGFDPKAASDQLDESAAGLLLRTALLADEAHRVDLRVSDAEVRRYLRQLTRAEDGTALDQDLVINYAQREYGSLKRFQEALRDDLLAQKLARLIGETVAISEAEALDALRYRREEVSLALVHLEATAPAEDPELAPEEVAALLESDASVVREAYEKRKEEFDRPEAVRARHVLIRADKDAEGADLELARSRAQEILDRIRDGADFADVALELSEDPGSKELGGDLGFFPRGSMVKPFEDAAFGLPVGEVSDLVRSVNGFHVIRVEEKRPALVTPFEEAQEQIAREMLVSRAAMAEARVRAEELAEAVREGQSLVDAARERSIPIQRPDAFRRRGDGYVPGVGAFPEVMTAAFALREDAPSDETSYEVGDDALVMIQLLERTSPSSEELEPLVGQEQQRLLRERRSMIETAWVESLRQDAIESGDLIYDLTPLRR